MRRRAKLIAAALTCSLVALAPLRALAASTPHSAIAAQLLANALANAAKQVSVQEHSTDSELDGSSVSFVTDAGTNSGIQQISYTKSHTTGHLTDVVAGNTAYFRGDSFSLTNFFGFSALAAAHIAGDWVSVAKSNKAYSVVAADLTVGSAIRDVAVIGVLSPTSSTMTVGNTTTVDGQRVISVTASATGNGQTTTATLYISRAKLALPVREVVVALKGSQHGKSVIDFGRWGEKVSIGAPKGAIPISSIPTN